MTALDRVLWAIQSNRLGFAHTHDVYKLTSFLDHQGTPYRPVETIPFDDAPIEIEPWDGPVIFYGSTKLVERVAKNNRWRPGVYYDEARFEFEAQLAGWGSLMLNADSAVMPLGTILDANKAPDSEWFIRPASNMKVFVGGVRKFREMPELLERGSKSIATRETLVQVAVPKAIDREWRTILVDGRVVTGSQYRAHGQQMKHGDYGTLDDHVVVFAEAAARRYQPAPVFVLDVGELTDGTLRVVEINCFNCSGWYWSDFYAIAREVTAYAAKCG